MFLVFHCASGTEKKTKRNEKKSRDIGEWNSIYIRCTVAVPLFSSSYPAPPPESLPAMVYTMGNRAFAFALALLIVAPLAVVAVILVVGRVVVIVFDDADDDNDDAKPEQQTQQERLMIRPIQRSEFRIEEETIVKKNAIVETSLSSIFKSCQNYNTYL